MGDLFVDVYANGLWKDSVVHLTGNMGDLWHEQVIQLSDAFPQLSTAVARVQVRFRGITGSAYDSDICVDDFRVTGTATPIVTIDRFAASRPTLAHFGNYIRYRNVFGQLTIFMPNGKGSWQ